MLNKFKTQLQQHLQQALQKKFNAREFPPVELEIPADKQHGEFACNVAMRAAKLFKKPPLAIADEFLQVINESLEGNSFNRDIDKVEVKKPGFINFYLSKEKIQSILDQIFKEDKKYGCQDIGQKKKVQIEFVSANPTGPLSVAHARQAAVGDALGNILDRLGFKVTKEYYVNDGGNQINLLGESIKCRGYELFGKEADLPEGGYQGEYIKDIAADSMETGSIKDLESLTSTSVDYFSKDGSERILNIIKKDLKDFGVEFDVYSHESEIATEDQIEGILAYLGEKGFIYEKDGAIWFKSTDFGDDKDRVLQKSDDTFTYLTPDIVYHKNKYDRGFDWVINIWGPDHHGYIPRLTAAVEALGKDREALKVLIVQLATIFRDGVELSMSTRKGQFISLREVLDEVGSDAARFFFLMRHIKAHLEFDLELAKKQTNENPVYYVQYAHARMFSINKKAKEEGLKAVKKGFSRLKEEEEIDLIKKLGAFPDALQACHSQLDPCPLVTYLMECASTFHRFYDKHRVVGEDKELSAQRLGLVNATRIVIGNGLHILGISAPESM